MDSYIRGELMLMADALVAERNREFCRGNTNLDFLTLEGNWVEHREFNNYMQALRQKVGFIGPRLVGKQIAKTLDKLFGSLTKAADVIEAFDTIPEIYKENNKGMDSGKYLIERLEDGFIKVVSTSPLDEGFHLGVGEGFIRFYNKMVTRVEMTESMNTHSRTVFEYEWRR
ncbi:MAG: hypothetical protein KAH30_04675 [Caldisericia bacterium]|nr:hypothetical protein [Caldisericia bacterium]